MLFEDELPQESHIHRIEPGKRLVENEQIRLVDHSSHELHCRDEVWSFIAQIREIEGL